MRAATPTLGSPRDVIRTNSSSIGGWNPRRRNFRPPARGPQEPLVMPVDDTLTKRRGRKVFGCFWHHDATANSHKGSVAWGNNRGHRRDQRQAAVFEADRLPVGVVAPLAPAPQVRRLGVGSPAAVVDQHAAVLGLAGTVTRARARSRGASSCSARRSAAHASRFTPRHSSTPSPPTSCGSRCSPLWPGPIK